MFPKPSSSSNSSSAGSPSRPQIISTSAICHLSMDRQYRGRESGSPQPGPSRAMRLDPSVFLESHPLGVTTPTTEEYVELPMEFRKILSSSSISRVSQEEVSMDEIRVDDRDSSTKGLSALSMMADMGSMASTSIRSSWSTTSQQLWSRLCVACLTSSNALAQYMRVKVQRLLDVFKRHEISINSDDDAMTATKVKKYLDTHQQFLYNYILETVSINALKQLYIEKVEEEKNFAQTSINPTLNVSHDDEGNSTHVVDILKIKRSPRFDNIGARYLDKMQQNSLTDFLLTTVRSIFEEMVSLDCVIQRILHFAQHLVNADRASLFLVDLENSQLVSTVFDQQLNEKSTGKKKEIRIPISMGIAGHVMSTGELYNIPDAYRDEKFNRAVDEETGYRTKSILSMPIKVKGQIIGVVQMINKVGGGPFTFLDEASFNVFATFFGLALHHAQLYDQITRKEQQYKVALEVLSYHNTCRKEEVDSLDQLGMNLPWTLNTFYFDPYELTPSQMCQGFIIMFDDLFGLQNFEKQNVQSFILTVKKNYRDVPYHNFHHGWSVAQTMYTILKADTSLHFSHEQRLALFVASICHDLDHRGFTNKYMSETAAPLAAMYTTSTLEHHHFNTTVTILQQDNHNIFSRYSTEEYRNILKLIKMCILATDLVAFFPNLAQIQKLLNDEPTFDWKNQRHCELAMAITMTAADLSASAKPWDIQNKTVEVIFKEFYDQGDKEKAAGKEPLPMMDRNKATEQAASQVGFISQILPCYKALETLLPYTKEMYEMAADNLETWIKKRDNTNYEQYYDILEEDNDDVDFSSGTLSSLSSLSS